MKLVDCLNDEAYFAPGDVVEIVLKHVIANCSQVELEYKNPKSQDRVVQGKLPQMWGQSLYVLGRLVKEVRWLPLIVLYIPFVFMCFLKCDWFSLRRSHSENVFCLLILGFLVSWRNRPLESPLDSRT